MVNQELLLRNEYLGAENRILRGKIKDRLLPSEGEKATLAEIAHRLGREALENLAATANPGERRPMCLSQRCYGSGVKCCASEHELTVELRRDDGVGRDPCLASIHMLQFGESGEQRQR